MKQTRVVGFAISTVASLALIAAVVAWLQTQHSLYYPHASAILSAFKTTWLSSHFSSDVVPSIERMAIGYALSCVIGFGAGCIIGLSKVVATLTSPIVEFLRAIPPTALIPFGIVLLGIGDPMKIGIITLGCLFPVLLNTVDGIRGINQTLVDTARAYRISGVDRVRSVLLPAAGPQIVAGMRTSLSIALILMVVSELVASNNGIGYFILLSQRTFALPEMWSGVLLLGILGFLLNAIFVFVEHRVLAWHRGVTGQISK